MAITVEELEIVVEANVSKVMPQIRKMMQQIKSEFDSGIDFGGLGSGISKEVEKARPAIKKVKDEFNPDELSPNLLKQLDEMKSKISGARTELGKFYKDTSAGKVSVDVETNNAGWSKTGSAMADSQANTSGEERKLSLWTRIKAQVDAYRDAIMNTNISWGDKSLGNLGSLLDSAKAKVKEMAGSALKLSGNFLKSKFSSKDMGNSLSGGLKIIKKYALALIGIRSTYQALKSMANEWLSSNDATAKQLKTNLDYLKMSIGQALAPVIQFIVNLLYKALSVVQSLVYAIAQVNIFSKASASNYKNIASSASKASNSAKQLAGVHNEINNISDSNGSDSGTGTPSMDLSTLDSDATSILDKFMGDPYALGMEIGKSLCEALDSIPWDTIQKKVVELSSKFAQFLNGIVDSHVFESIGDTLGEGINTILMGLATFYQTFNWKNFGQQLMSGLMHMIDTIDWGLVATNISEQFVMMIETLSGLIQGIDWGVLLDALIEFIKGIEWGKVAESIFECLGTAFASIAELIATLGNYITEGIKNGIEVDWSKIGDWVVEHIFQPFINGVKSVFGIASPSKVMAEIGVYIMEGLKEGILSLIDKIKEIWNNIKQFTSDVFTTIKNIVVNIINNLKSNVVTAITNIKNGWINIFNNVKSTTINIFNGIWSGIKGIINKIIGGIENMANSVIDGVNGMTKGLDGIVNSAGKIFGVDIHVPQISRISLPRLATGNVAFGETLGIFGEYAGANTNPEITAPQSILRDTFADVLSEYGSGKATTIENNIILNGKKISKQVIKDINDMSDSMGKSVINFAM